MRYAFLIPFIIMLAFGLVFSGCAQPAPTPPETTPTPTATVLTPKYGGMLRLAGDTIPANIGWPAEMVPTVYGAVQYSFDTLLRGDNKGNIIPWLAESYKIAEDLKSMTFTLRKGVKFIDSSDFNAEVAKWNLDNMIAGRVEPYWASVDIIDDYTIRVNFTEWMNTIPMSFGDDLTLAFMVSKAAFDKNGVEWMRANAVGTGPFKLESFQQDVSLKFVKNPNYWVDGKPYLDGIETKIVADPNTRALLLKAGEIDFETNGWLKDVAQYTAMGMTMATNPNENYLLVPDTANVDSPWANKKVREAAEYAIDREAIANAFGYGYWEPLYQIPTRNSTVYDPNFPLARKYNLEKAKQLLAEAGYPGGFKTTMVAVPSLLARDLGAAVQADLAKVGIDLDLEFPEFAKFILNAFPGGAPTNTVLLDSQFRYDPNFAGGLQFTFNMKGTSWLRTPELTQAYKAALSSPASDPKLIRAVTDIITRDALLIPLCENVSLSVKQPYVIINMYERGLQSYWNTEDAWLNK